jgi:Rv2632c-like
MQRAEFEVRAMNRDDHWSVSLSVAETDGRTHAEARLDMAGGGQFAGGGEARLNPADQDIWMIGAQIAAARALSDLAGHFSTPPPPVLRRSPTNGPS